jgi:hypothetical protein
MAKKRTNKATAKKSVKRKPRTARTPKGAISAYLRMLADPCGASMVHAPYAGTGSGYLVRTRVTFTPAPGSGAGSTNNYFVQFTPAGAAANGFVQQLYGGITYTTLALSDFLTSGVVDKARPLAACLKWVPTGPVTSRQGVVGMGYISGALVTSGATPVSHPTLLNSCNVLSSNGAQPHEVRWMPTIADEIYTNPNAAVATEVSGGSVYINLVGVDATSGTPNGYFEATTIYEWTPASNQGAAPSITTPPKYTMREALDQIRDLGEFLFGDAMAAIGGMARETATTMLTGATYALGRRAGLLTF